MEKKKIENAVNWLEALLKDFQKAKAMGKKTNDNAERAQSITDIEEITEKLETYIRNNEGLLEQLTGTNIEVVGEIDWNDVVRPSHFEEDLQGEIDKLKKQIS
ncbi:hypothetical protein LZ575_20240 [Antarcticibacterium sp. 1MA-6-2]|uniref:hypothetical protein n=1 Tax=Antarcticibacterium sp. 1MA-6-2 TaxID=2908210 RepID=UPI001F435933|nr:hypothetical protein [Antarcticibacterium sp. 1MA-6-2]UJH90980.1 hypothetical protein LZ575_20240 [Antarcticibacterium sp. 1MA-6-2]